MKLFNNNSNRNNTYWQWLRLPTPCVLQYTPCILNVTILHFEVIYSTVCNAPLPATQVSFSAFCMCFHLNFVANRNLCSFLSFVLLSYLYLPSKMFSLRFCLSFYLKNVWTSVSSSLHRRNLPLANWFMELDLQVCSSIMKVFCFCDVLQCA